MKVYLKKVHPAAIMPTYGSLGAAGADLYALPDADHPVVIASGETAFIHTGVAAAIPAGYVGLVYARSGLACKRGLAPANKVGVIDSDYRGEMIQSIVAVNLYRLWFSYPNMTAITWWNLVDDCGYKGEPTISGIYTRDMKPKIVYYALNNLINKEWRTNVMVKPNGKGEISWRGFKGNYRITWVDKEGVTHSEEYHLK